MDPHLPPALARRLAAYSASAGVALTVGPVAGAQQEAPAEIDPDRAITSSEVVYHDLDPDVIIVAPGYGTSSFDLDLDLDGAEDLKVFACYRYGRCHPRGGTFRAGLKLPDGADAQNGILGYLSDGDVGASRLSTGDPIGLPDSGQRFYDYALAAYNAWIGEPRFPFVGRRGYAGFRFVAGDGQLRYGWLRLGVNEARPGDSRAFKAVVYGYAYAVEPEAPIAAGDTSNYSPEVLLEGTVNQTVFPPEGGTLTFTATVTNTTDEPAELDLWAVARKPSGRFLAVRRLGAVVVPAGATVTETVTTQIPAGTPPGTAEVRFHIGRFPLVVDSEVFSITKQPGAHAAEAEGEAAFFAEEATSAAVSGAVPGTHALSAPRPNPTTGRSEVTLQVAEAQHVSVSVFDALGRRVAVLHDGALAAGAEHRLAFDGSGLPAGVYVVRAVGAAFADARVLTLTR